MLKNCKKCHKEFNASSEDVDVCPRCLKDEFASADQIKADDLAELAQETRINYRRQMARVEKMNIGYTSNSVFNFAGKLHFMFGILLFLFCAIMFFIGDSETVKTPINQLPIGVQKTFSVVLCLVSAGLLLFSFKRHKAMVLAVAVAMVASGYFMPVFWHYRGEDDARAILNPEGEGTSGENTETAAATDYVPLTDEELNCVYEIPKSVSRKTYGIYINDAGAQVRTVLHEAFKRLFVASEVQVRDCREGTLFVVVNAQNKDSRAVEKVLGRIGTIVHSSRASGQMDQDSRTLVYEVQGDDASLADLRGDTLSADMYDATRGDFIGLNLKELEHLDVRRVEKAAKRLKDNPSTSFRLDVCVGLLRVLHSQPWASSQGAYTQMIETLVQYGEGLSEKENTLQDQVTDTCLEYFKNCCMAQSAQRKSAPVHVPDTVLNYLVERVPDSLVDSVFAQWKRNAVDWNREVSMLGSRMEPKVVELLEETDLTDITRINEIISYLKRYGTARCVPALQRFVNHEDQIIQQSAKEIISRFQ